MKSYNKIIISGFLLTIVFSFLSFNATSEEISHETLRFHVPANSDSEYDQRIKLEVKEEISVLADSLTKSAHSVQEAEEILKENLTVIESEANEVLERLNAGYKARAVVEKDFFATREYDTFTLPAGEYKALKVILGSGEGKNWWCVVYPSLCVSAAAEDFDMLSKKEQELIDSKPKVSFKLYEWYLELRQMLSGK